MFMSVTITNEETGVIISRALNLKDPELVFDVPDWPGKTFTLGSDDAKEHDAALALLGTYRGNEQAVLFTDIVRLAKWPRC